MPQEKAENLNDLLVMKLQALYFAETEITKALPKMVESASSEELKTAFQSHLKETETHVQRLNQALEELDAKVEPLESEAVTGLIEDTKWCMDNIDQGPVLDAALISSAQYVEHFEMAGYGTASTWAEQIGEMEVKSLLGMTLDEEKAADEKLSALAMIKVNEQASDEEIEEASRGGILGRMEPSGI
ncbi:MAG: ferritin-like domain-containing protein [Candidatus Doudnabacteria bacterium]|nr:ferritin-like domain-containing protein [Candidatus Doudnabacteria bacterium]